MLGYNAAVYSSLHALHYSKAVTVHMWFGANIFCLGSTN